MAILSHLSAVRIFLKFSPTLSFPTKLDYIFKFLRYSVFAILYMKGFKLLRAQAIVTRICIEPVRTCSKAELGFVLALLFSKRILIIFVVVSFLRKPKNDLVKELHELMRPLLVTYWWFLIAGVRFIGSHCGCVSTCRPQPTILLTHFL